MDAAFRRRPGVGICLTFSKEGCSEMGVNGFIVAGGALLSILGPMISDGPGADGKISPWSGIQR